jgi:hypothetical protein
MKKYSLILAGLLFFLSSFTPPAESVTVPSELKTATVYRSGAALTHNATASLKAGDNELIIEELSSYLDINSIQVNCPASVTILGIEFSNNYMGEENISPHVKLLKDSIETINMSIQRISTFINTSTELLEVLRMNRDVKGTQAGMSVAELTKLMAYYKTKSLEVQNDLIDYKLKKTKLEQQSAKILLQITEEQAKNTTSGGRLVLQLNVAIGGTQDFVVSYITQNAYWTPYYDVRAENIKSPLKFIYKAKISQTTGIDWKKVKLSLSTSSPKQFGNAPVFKTWFMGYIDPINAMNRDLEKYKDNNIQSSLEGRVPGLSITQTNNDLTNAKINIRGIRSLTGNNEPLFVVNGTPISKENFSKINAANIKDTKVLTSSSAVAIYGPEAANGVVLVTLKDGLDDYVTVTDSELDLTYDIDLPYDVPTNGKQQIATLQETTVPASYKYYAVPKLDKDAFLLAEIANWQTLNLLPGEANIIFEGTYIGKSFIDPANTNDTLNLTLGTDKRVVIKKEKMTDYSSVKFLGSNKLQTLTYELTVKNNKKEPINIILKDQYPISTNKEIEVSLLESAEASVNEEIGVATWMLKIEPGTSKKVRISYSVKYPKGKVVNLN